MTHEQAHAAKILTRKLKKALNQGAPFNQIMALVHQLAETVEPFELTADATRFWLKL